MDPITSAALYAAGRDRILAAARDFSPAELDRAVPACPDWTVHDLLAHLTGVATDFVQGNLDGAPFPPWTDRQVAPRRQLPASAVLAEWSASSVLLEQLITSGTTSHPLVCNPYADASVHEADLRGAVGIPRPPREAYLATVEWMLDGAASGVAVHTPDGTYWLESDGPAAEVPVDSYELFRAVFGRRSAAQIRSWAWSSPEAAAVWSTELPMLPQTAVDLVD
ncbi:maleylpyruvate isomerase family mycothiol-dependent enzyme [Kribbella lupini]|uniref:Maleylpyruvate isomerase family mycothiol-dependent enzyme n=1 Tax=Kribbella lupini TaxID=291602 RepID=A0ABP4NAR6_9ACTN